MPEPQRPALRPRRGLRNRPLSQAGPRIFQRACDLASVPAGEAAMVGDTPETDVQGARQAGLILFVRSFNRRCSRVLTAPAIGFVIICS
jgi:phosphoglycolate phosphatase-like HAD superfamily hydrolase